MVGLEACFLRISQIVSCYIAYNIYIIWSIYIYMIYIYI